MKFFKPRYAEAGHRNYATRHNNKVSRPISGYLNQGSRLLLIVLVLIVGSNFLSHMIWNPGIGTHSGPASDEPLTDPGNDDLYLMDKASLYVEDERLFKHKVKEIAAQLQIPPSWLMSVMYSESRFDASVLNHKGSGATGLIQFMPATATDLNVSVQRLKKMTHTQQLEYVYLYLEQVRERYGEYDSLTDLYLAILYPKARKQDICYTLYAKPSQSYLQNSGLDKDKDGRVTVSDIDRHMEKLYPFAYSQRKHEG